MDKLDVLLPYLDAFGTLLHSKLSLDLSKKILLFIFVGSCVSKILPAGAKSMSKLWPTLPSWFWPACGVFELAICATLYLDRVELSVPLIFAMLGGVISSLSIMGRQGNYLPFWPAPIATSGIVLGLAKHSNYKVTNIVPAAAAGGFLIGAFIGNVLAAPRSPKKKA